MLNMFFAFYVIAIMVITMIIYIPLIIQKKVSLKDFIIKYIKINITNICIYFFADHLKVDSGNSLKTKWLPEDRES